MTRSATLRALALPIALSAIALPSSNLSAQADDATGMLDRDPIQRARADGREESIQDREMLSKTALPGQFSAGETLQIGGKRTFSFDQSIGRIDIDREGIVKVTSPTARSISLVGLVQGNVTVTVFGRDGGLLGETRFSVLPETPYQSVVSNFPLAGQKVVAVDLQFAAVSTSTLKALGFNFSKLSGDIQGAIVARSSLAGYTNSSSGLTVDAKAPIASAFNLFLSGPKRGIGAVLRSLSSNGLSSVLAQPTLLARSGEKATFLAGGEFPVPVPQASANGGNSLGIAYKEYGVRLSVTPYVLSKDHIVLNLAPEVSELDYASGVQLQGYIVPGIRRRSAETTVELGSGQSFVIAGLNYDTSSVTKDKVPLLGDIPVLGALFKRQQTTKEKQELIIVATPRLVDPLAPDQVPPLPGAAGLPDPTYGQMIVGNDGVEDAVAKFGVERR